MAIKKLTLHAFGKVVEDITQKPAEDVSVGAMLKVLSHFNMVYTDGIIQSVSMQLAANFTLDLWSHVYNISLYCKQYIGHRMLILTNNVRVELVVLS